MKKDGELWRRSRLRQVKYLNNIVEQDHRGETINRPRARLWWLLDSPTNLAGYEAMVMIRTVSAAGVTALELDHHMLAAETVTHGIGSVSRSRNEQACR